MVSRGSPSRGREQTLSLSEFSEQQLTSTVNRPLLVPRKLCQYCGAVCGTRNSNFTV
jgi:hypothetical protein